MDLKGRSFLKLLDYTPEEMPVSSGSGCRAERQEEKRDSGRYIKGQKRRTDF